MLEVGEHAGIEPYVRQALRLCRGRFLQHDVARAVAARLLAARLHPVVALAPAVALKLRALVAGQVRRAAVLGCEIQGGVRD